MSSIVETEALVLSKLDYGDTSSIISLYTKDKGRFSVILKGGRNPRSKMGMIADPLNYLHVIIYDKPTRDLQLLTSAEIISHYPNVKSDFSKIKHSQAILELIKKLTPEHEPNLRIFKGVIRIFDLLENSEEMAEILFGRFFMFFLKELGYELQLNKCSSCGKTTLRNIELSYNFEIGILCQECRSSFLENFRVQAELFEYLLCLKYNERLENPNTGIVERGNIFMEKFLMYHISDFKGIQTFQLLKENL